MHLYTYSQGLKADLFLSVGKVAVFGFSDDPESVSGWKYRRHDGLADLLRTSGHSC